MDFIKTITQKVSNFLANCETLDLVILGVILLIPILAIAFVAASKSYCKQEVSKVKSIYYHNRSRRFSNARPGSGGGRRRKRKGGKRHSSPARLEYPRREFQVRYVPALEFRDSRPPARVIKVPKKTDGAAILATGIFGLGLGLMIHRVAKDEHGPI